MTQIRGAGRDLLESLEEERELADLEGEPQRSSAPFDLGRALALAVRAASRPARGRGVTLRLQMGRSVPPRFVGDAGRVERLVRVWIRGFLAASHSETITLAVALRGERQDCAVVRFTLLGPADAPAAGDSQLSESGPQLYGGHDSAPLAARLLEALGGEAVPTAEAGRHALAAFELPLVPARPRSVATSGARLNPTKRAGGSGNARDPYSPPRRAAAPWIGRADPQVPVAPDRRRVGHRRHDGNVVSHVREAIARGFPNNPLHPHLVGIMLVMDARRAHRPRRPGGQKSTTPERIPKIDEMIVGPPAAPATNTTFPSGPMTIVGVIEESIRFPGRWRSPRSGGGRPSSASRASR